MQKIIAARKIKLQLVFSIGINNYYSVPKK